MRKEFNPHSSKGVICLGHATLTWPEYRPPKHKTTIKTITNSEDHAVDHALPFSPLEKAHIRFQAVIYPNSFIFFSYFVKGNFASMYVFTI